jgi:hypothetical protein
MNNRWEDLRALGTVEIRPTIAMHATQFDVLSGAGVAAGQRVLKVETPFVVLMLPMSIEVATLLGQGLSAPGVHLAK